jgi:hypothetical protein
VGLFVAQSYILSSGALWPLADGVGHVLAFAEVVELYPIDSRTVKEHVSVAALGRDETESLVSDSFDRTLFHFLSNTLQNSCVSPVCAKRSHNLSNTVVVINTAGKSDDSADGVVFVVVPLIVVGRRFLDRRMCQGFFVRHTLR